MRNVVTVSDEKAVYRTIERPGNVVLQAEAGDVMDGFMPDYLSSYRNPSVNRVPLHMKTRTPSILGFTNQVEGSYYLGVVMLDFAFWPEPFAIWVDAAKLADVCADANDNRVHMFVCREKLRLKGGERIRIETGAADGLFQTEAFVLLKRLPAPSGPREKIKPLVFPKPVKSAGARSRTIPLTISGRRGVEAENFPLTTGVPLPQGSLYDSRRVALFDHSRQAVPVQTRVTGQWPDGSVRWLLLDFQHDVHNQDQPLRVRYGRDLPPLPRRRPLAKRVRDGVRIDTGAAVIDVPETDLFLPGRVTLTANGEPLAVTAPAPGVELRTASPRKTYRSRGRVTGLKIEENGPLRAVVRVDCTHSDPSGRSLFLSTARIHAYAGKAWFRVAYTFTNDNTESEFTELRELTLRTRLARAAGERVHVVQDLDNHFIETGAGGTVREGRRFPGTIRTRTGDTVAAVAVKDFWQNYPKSLAVRRNELEVGICPDVSGTDYRVGGYEEDRLYYYLCDGAYKLKCGTSRTHDLFYGFAPWNGAAALRAEAKAFLATPLVRVQPRAVLRSGVVGHMPEKGQGMAACERSLEEAHRGFLAHRKAVRAYGMMNYGDWFGERRYNWGNAEYDTPWVFLNEYVRGGDDACFDIAAAGAGHQVDVDTCHASANPGDVGGQYPHSMGHVGGYYPEGYRELARAVVGIAGVTHTWIEGQLFYYGLTGDERVYENALATAARMAASVDPVSYDFSICREPGWLLIHMCAAFLATNQRRCIDAAQVVVERVLERQRDSGGWERMLVWGHCFCDPPRHRGNASFAVGLLLAGMKRYHQITGDRRVRRCIVRGAEYLIDANWIPDERVFRYTNCPHIWGNAGQNAQLLEGLGYAWRLSRSPKIGQVLIDAMERCFAPEESVQKAFVSAYTRAAPFAMFNYEDAKRRLG